MTTPYSFEKVEMDRRKSPEATAARVEGRAVHSTDPDNGQLFANGGDVRADTILEQLDPNRLFNGKPPNLAIDHEKPEHRSIMVHKANGLSNREIAERTGYSEGWISQLTRQPWFRAGFVRLMHEVGVDTVQTLLKGEVLPSLYKLVELRDTAESETVQKAAADSLLDRFLGKATQRVENYDGGKAPGLEDLERLEQDLDLTRKEVDRLEGKTINISPVQSRSAEPITPSAA